MANDGYTEYGGKNAKDRFLNQSPNQRRHIPEFGDIKKNPSCEGSHSASVQNYLLQDLQEIIDCPMARYTTNHPSPPDHKYHCWRYLLHLLPAPHCPL